jgi:hypothetical protein
MGKQLIFSVTPTIRRSLASCGKNQNAPMTNCLHGFIIDPTEPDLLRVDVSKYCLRCWDRHASLLTSLHCHKPDVDEPCKYGFCDLIKKAVRKRGWYRDKDGQESKYLDLRIRLLEKEAVITEKIKGRDKAYIDNYIWRVLKNRLTNDQTSSEGLVIQKSVKSISPDGSPTDREQPATNDGDERLDSDESLRQKDEKFRDECVRQSGEMMEEFHKWRDSASTRPRKRGKTPSEAKELFDSLMADASSQIATLTGGRKDGFETYLDLEKALSTISDAERSVFEALWLENGELLARSRTYSDVEYMLGLTNQNVRTLEHRAIQKLKPALGPSFFKRRLPVDKS